VESPFVDGGAQFSKDGKWIAYASNDTGRFEIYVRPLAKNGTPRRVSTRGGNLPRWAHSGAELFYLAPDGTLMSVPVSGFGGTQLTIGTPSELFASPIDPSGFSTRSPYVVSLDDQRFLLPIAVDQPTPATLVIIRNWQPRQ
jgi:Tol biopolymer transport system component